MLQSPFLSRIGGSQLVRDSLTAALAEGRGVTAKVRWMNGRHGDEEGRIRWIHCTPLLGSTGTVGVWMIVLVDDETSAPLRKFRAAPPVSTEIGTPRKASFASTTLMGGGRNSATLRGERPGTGGSGNDGSVEDNRAGSFQSFGLA